MRTLLAALALLSLPACGDFGGPTENPEEVITTMILAFTPIGGGAPVAFEFDDPDGDGGQPPTVQPVNLANRMYTLTVQFVNRLPTVPEDITTEVMDEADVHLLLFTGSAVVGPATTNTTGPLLHAYADMDESGLPIGLTNTIMARSGTGELIVTLRHMPPEEPPEKAADTLDLVRANGIDSIGGSTDASVTFMVTVP
jgi:hypothetical protein